MSFDIFAAGTGNFHYEKKSCEDGSTFNAIDMISTLQGLDVSSLANAGTSYANSKVDPTNDPASIVDVMFHILRKEMLHNLSNAVCFLAMKSTEDGWIYVNAVETHTFWADTNRAARYSFSPGESPGAEFVQRIVNCLKDTNMDNWGVIQQLSIALNNYANSIEDTATPKITISLTN